MAETDKQLALRALRDALQDSDAKPAERVRAAEALLRAEAASLAEAADLLEATDAELLAIARGETGATPREMGPAVPAAESVPSGAPAERPTLTATSNPFLRRGPKTDPPLATPGGPIPLEGPKTDPPIATGGGPISGQFASPAENGHDPDPWT